MDPKENETTSPAETAERLTPPELWSQPSTNRVGYNTVQQEGCGQTPPLSILSLAAGLTLNTNQNTGGNRLAGHHPTVDDGSNAKRKLYASPAGDLHASRAQRYGAERNLKRFCSMSLDSQLQRANSNRLPAPAPHSLASELSLCASAPQPFREHEMQLASSRRQQRPFLELFAQQEARSVDGWGLIGVAACPESTTQSEPLACLGGALDSCDSFNSSPRPQQPSNSPRLSLHTSPVHFHCGVGKTHQQIKRRSFSPLQEGPTSVLPMVVDSDTGLPSVSPETVRQLLTEQHRYPIDSYVLIDCRYAYEHQGGTLPGALHMPHPHEVERYTFGGGGSIIGGRTAIIFFCEFSSERGPRMFRYVRNKDRRNHMATYPELGFPHMYVLQGGYKAFWQACPQLCVPEAYVRMVDVRFCEELRQCNSDAKRAWSFHTGRPQPLSPAAPCPVLTNSISLQ